MVTACRLALISTAVLLSSATLADDAAPDETVPDVTLAVEAFLAELENVPRWRPSQPVDVIAFSELSLHPLHDVNFEDSDILSRVSKLRGLSMLTMAEIGAARLFFGVNDDGLVGLHVNTSAGNRDGRHIEVFRMPYLSEDPVAENTAGR